MDYKLFEIVKRSANFQNDDDVKIFEEGVWKLAETQDKETFKNLITLFDDETDHPDVMFNLVHALEKYPDEKYVTLILQSLKFLTDNNEEWYARLIIRILNDDNCSCLFIKQFNELDSVSINKIIEIVKENYPEKLRLLKIKN